MGAQRELVPANTKQPATQIAITPMSILASAVERGVDVSQLEKLMDLQERFEAKEAKKAFDKALAAFKAKPLTIDKDGEVDYTFNGKRTNYRHATLQNVAEKAGKQLAENGLSFSWRTSQNGGNITVTCILSHEFGHSEETSLSAGADTSGGKNSIQAIGSTISYLQRYTLLSITGLATGDMDDDGNGADDITQPNKSTPNNNQQQQNKTKEQEVNMKAIQPWLNRLDEFKVGVHTSDQLDKQWRAAHDRLTKLSPADQAYLTAKFEEKLEIMEGVK